MYKYLNLIQENQENIQIGINEESPMTLFIKVNKDGFSGFGSIYFDDLSIKKMQKDFIEFLNYETSQLIISDTDSKDYYFHMLRKNGFIEIKGKIGNYTDISLDFFIEFLEQKITDKTEIIELVNQIQI